jgi:hypothetical protein
LTNGDYRENIAQHRWGFDPLKLKRLSERHLKALWKTETKLFL